MKQNQLTLLSVAVLLALLVAAVMPLAAFAQDQTPPPADPPAAEVPPADAPVADAPVADVPVADAPVADASVADAPVVDAPAEDLTIPEALAQLPEGADLIVTDSNGETLPLASQEAADALSGGDPFYTDGANVIGFSTGVCAPAVTVCNVTATPLADAIAAYAASGTATGAITVEAGSYAAGVTIDGTNGNLINLTGLIGAGSGTTALTGNVTVTNMNGFTFSGFDLTGGFRAKGNAGTLTLSDLVVTNNAGVSIFVEDHTGDIVLTDVNSSGNIGDGAYLDNTAGNGAITLTGANVFNDNGANGLFAYSAGAISANKVTASGNTGYGAYLNNTSGTGAITLTGPNGFNDNKSDGLRAFSAGAISASNVTATGNINKGVYISTPGTVMLSSANVFSGNSTDGLYLAAGTGNVTVNATIANNPSGSGIVNNVGAGNILTLNCVTFSSNGTDISGPGNMVDACAPSAPVFGGGEEKTAVTDYLCVANAVAYEEKDLPGALVNGAAFQVGWNVSICGSEIDVTTQSVSISFDIPADLKGKTLTVLFWEDGKWVEIVSKVVGDQLVFTGDKSGSYVVVAAP